MDRKWPISLLSLYKPLLHFQLYWNNPLAALCPLPTVPVLGHTACSAFLKLTGGPSVSHLCILYSFVPETIQNYMSIFLKHLYWSVATLFKSTLPFSMHRPSKMQRAWKVTSSQFLIFNQTSLSSSAVITFHLILDLSRLFPSLTLAVLFLPFIRLCDKKLILSPSPFNYFLFLYLTLFRPAQDFENIKSTDNKKYKSNTPCNVLYHTTEDKERKLRLMSGNE